MKLNKYAERIGLSLLEIIDGCKGSMKEKSPGRKKEKEVITLLKVKGMSCQHCVMSVTKALSQLEGVKNVQVDLQKGEVRFDNTKRIASDRIEKAVSEAGYEVVSQRA